MLRSAFVIVILVVGGVNALRGPFEGLLFYLWIAYFRPEFWLWDPAFFRSLSPSFNVGVYLVARTLPRLPRARFDLRCVLFLAFLLLTCVSALASKRSVYSWAQWIDFAKTTSIAYFLYVLASEDLDKFHKTLLVLAVSLGFEAVKQGYADLILHPGGLNANSLPQLGDNNDVAVGMLMLVAIFLGFARVAENKWEKRLHFFLMFGVLYRAISTYSRGGFLAAATLGLAYTARSNQKIRVGLTTLVVGAVIGISLPQQFWDRMSTMNVTEENQLDGSSAGRLHFWRVAIRMANDSPLVGKGFNTYEKFYDEFDFSNGFYGRGRAVHSMWFGVLADLGYTGLILFVSLFAFGLIGMSWVARRARAGELPMTFYHYAVALQSAFAACMVGGSFVPWHYQEMLYHVIALSMALRAIAIKTIAASGAHPAYSSPEAVPSSFRPANAAARVPA